MRWESLKNYDYKPDSGYYYATHGNPMGAKRLAITFLLIEIYRVTTSRPGFDSSTTIYYRWNGNTGEVNNQTTFSHLAGPLPLPPPLEELPDD